MLFIAISLCLGGIVYFGLSGIPEGHIEENVPEQEYLDDYLQRDLERYFTELKSEPIQIEYILLRDEPTQVGLTYPKYYVWVDIQTEDGYLESGAVYIVAISGEYFQVYDYKNEEEIKQDHSILYELFPDDVCDQIINIVDE